MRWLMVAAWAVLLAADMTAAQEPATPAAPPAPPPILVGPENSLTLPPVPALSSLWKQDGIDSGNHFTADVGFDVLWTRWSNSSSPAVGPNVSLGVFNEKGWGVGASWMQFDQSKSTTWGTLRRP